MYLCVKRCLKILDNFKYINLELFNDLEEKESNKIDASSICQSFNKALDKILKLQAISLVYLKFILSDFNYEGNIKTQVKRMIVSINEPLYLLIDIAIVNHINKSQEKQDSKIESSSRHKDFIDKFKKVSRYHRLYKSSQPSEALRNINKQLENSVFASKQFSK